MQDTLTNLIHYMSRTSVKGEFYDQEPFIGLPQSVKGNWWHGPEGEVYFYQGGLAFPLTLELHREIIAP